MGRLAAIQSRKDGRNGELVHETENVNSGGGNGSLSRVGSPLLLKLRKKFVDLVGIMQLQPWRHEYFERLAAENGKQPWNLPS
jgi:hypothetical protein